MKLEGKKAHSFFNDLQAGLSDAELMEKYSLTPRGLSLLRSQVDYYLKEKRAKARKTTRSVNVKAVLKDARAGMDDQHLMDKYSVTRRQLQKIFRKAIEAGLATPLELSNRLCITESQVTEAFVEAEEAIRELD